MVQSGDIDSLCGILVVETEPWWRRYGLWDAEFMEITGMGHYFWPGVASQVAKA